jgi:hypothetical protein
VAVYVKIAVAWNVMQYGLTVRNVFADFAASSAVKVNIQ